MTTKKGYPTINKQNPMSQIKMSSCSSSPAPPKRHAKISMSSSVYMGAGNPTTSTRPRLEGGHVGPPPSSARRLPLGDAAVVAAPPAPPAACRAACVIGSRHMVCLLCECVVCFHNTSSTTTSTYPNPNHPLRTLFPRSLHIRTTRACLVALQTSGCTTYVGRWGMNSGVHGNQRGKFTTNPRTIDNHLAQSPNTRTTRADAAGCRASTVAATIDGVATTCTRPGCLLKRSW